MSTPDWIFFAGRYSRFMKRRPSPQREPLPERERQICERLREMREELGHTQNEFATQVGINRQRLASYEEKRAPLRYDLALRFCRQFIISEEWLATGKCEACHAEARRRGAEEKGDWVGIDKDIFRKQCVDLLSDPVSLHIKPGTLFSEAFGTILSGRYAELLTEFYHTPRVCVTEADNSKLLINFLKAIHERHFKLLENEALGHGFRQSEVRRLYTARIYECSYLIFLKVFGLIAGKELPLKQLAQFDWLHAVSSEPTAPIGGPLTKVSGAVGDMARTGDENKREQDLPDSEISVKHDDVKAQLPGLLDRLKKAAAAPGQKTALADFLSKQSGSKIPLASVSRWLSGEREPGGEVTLKMIRWCELQERQPK
jgi:transcriptional regulator with XRE-family HTH domain